IFLVLLARTNRFRVIPTLLPAGAACKHEASSRWLKRRKYHTPLHKDIEDMIPDWLKLDHARTFVSLLSRMAALAGVALALAAPGRAQGAEIVHAPAISRGN